MEKQWWHIAPPDDAAFDLMVREHLTETAVGVTVLMHRMGAARLHWKALAATLAGTRKRNPSWVIVQRERGTYGNPVYYWRLPAQIKSS